MTWTLKITPITLGKRKLKTMRLPPSLNVRMHYMVRAKWTAAFREQSCWVAKEAKVPKLAKAQVTLVNRTCHPKDIDNLYGSVKPIIDGLVDAGVLPDDAAKFLDLQCRNEKVATLKSQEVLIEIT